MNESENLQYFPFATPQRVKSEEGIYRMVLGYWQDLSSPNGKTYYNQAHGELNSTGWVAGIPCTEAS